MDIYSDMRTYFLDLVRSRTWNQETIEVNVRTLKPEEAIGDPREKDYPIIKGRERMLEADFHGAKGQAFTDTAGWFQGTLQEIAELPLDDNFRRAVFTAGLNAVMRHADKIGGTIHCRDESPVTCAHELAAYVAERYDHPKIAMVGLQPRMVEALGSRFPLRVTDLDEENIGGKHYGVVIEDPKKTPANLEWCDVAVITGSAAVNATLGNLLTGKPTICFGVTGAAPCAILGLERFCPYGT
jgi:hypothetical protein